MVSCSFCASCSAAGAALPNSALLPTSASCAPALPCAVLRTVVSTRAALLSVVCGVLGSRSGNSLDGVSGALPSKVAARLCGLTPSAGTAPPVVGAALAAPAWAAAAPAAVPAAPAAPAPAAPAPAVEAPAA